MASEIPLNDGVSGMQSSKDGALRSQARAG